MRNNEANKYAKLRHYLAQNKHQKIKLFESGKLQFNRPKNRFMDNHLSKRSEFKMHIFNSDTQTTNRGGFGQSRTKKVKQEVQIEHKFEENDPKDFLKRQIFESCFLPTSEVLKFEKKLKNCSKNCLPQSIKREVKDASKNTMEKPNEKPILNNLKSFGHNNGNNFQNFFVKKEKENSNKDEKIFNLSINDINSIIKHEKMKNVTLPELVDYLSNKGSVVDNSEFGKSTKIFDKGELEEIKKSQNCFKPDFYSERNEQEQNYFELSENKKFVKKKHSEDDNKKTFSKLFKNSIFSVQNKIKKTNKKIKEIEQKQKNNAENIKNDKEKNTEIVEKNEKSEQKESIKFKLVKNQNKKLNQVKIKIFDTIKAPKNKQNNCLETASEKNEDKEITRESNIRRLLIEKNKVKPDDKSNESDEFEKESECIPLFDKRKTPTKKTKKPESIILTEESMDKHDFSFILECFHKQFPSAEEHEKNLKRVLFKITDVWENDSRNNLGFFKWRICLTCFCFYKIGKTQFNKHVKSHFQCCSLGIQDAFDEADLQSIVTEKLTKNKLIEPCGNPAGTKDQGRKKYRTPLYFSLQRAIYKMLRQPKWKDVCVLQQIQSDISFGGNSKNEAEFKFSLLKFEHEKEVKFSPQDMNKFIKKRKRLALDAMRFTFMKFYDKEMQRTRYLEQDIELITDIGLRRPRKKEKPNFQNKSIIMELKFKGDSEYSDMKYTHDMIALDPSFLENIERFKEDMCTLYEEAKKVGKGNVMRSAEEAKLICDKLYLDHMKQCILKGIAIRPEHLGKKQKVLQQEYSVLDSLWKVVKEIKSFRSKDQEVDKILKDYFEEWSKKPKVLSFFD